VGLGFSGAGWLGESLIKELPGFGSRLRLVAVQDANAELAAAVAERYGAAWHGADYDTLLAVPEVDAVVICTPNALHVPQSLAALSQRRHVLVQKPLARTADEARQLAIAAQQHDRLLFVDYSYRYLDTSRCLAAALASIGRVRSVSAAFRNIYGPGKAWFFDPRLSGGGALVDLGVHLVDLALALLQPRSVQLEQATLSFGAGLAVEDGATLALRLDDDLPVQVAATWNEPLPQTDIHLELHGERGTLRWENVDGSFFRFRTVLDGRLLLDRETTLREDTLRAFVDALDRHHAPEVDPRVYALLEAAYSQAGASAR
jgi:predicted dehydrogenase